MFKFLLVLFIFSLYPLFVSAHEGIHQIQLTKNGFVPKDLQIDLGEIVTFINIDEVDRWPASDIHPTHEIYPEFDPKKPLKSGQTWKFQFKESGVFRFHDHLTPEFNGSISVSGEIKSKKINTGVLEKINIALKKIYYTVFPDKLEQDLKSFNAVEMANKEEQLKLWLQLIGGQKYIQKMVADSEGGTKVDCHQEAHQVGRMAFRLEGSRIFKRLDYNCHSGFLHGALEAFITLTGGRDLTKNVTKICNNFKTDFTKFECLHGIGHGFTAYMSYDIPESLKLCKELPDEFARRSCFGGVFMENILVAEGKGAEAGHTTNWVSDDPHFPCNGVDKDYLVQYECYQMQTSRMLDLSKYSFDFIRSECLKAPKEMIEVCFKSMGRDIAGQVLRDPVKIQSICSTIPQQYFRICIQGAFNVVAEFWGENMEAQPHQVCNQLSSDDKTYCYTLLGGKLREIFAPDTDKINKMCALSEKDFTDICLHASL